MSSHPIAYTYEADHHCPDCTTLRFGTDEFGCVPEDAEDTEGNPVGAIFSWDEWFQPGEPGCDVLACSDCGEILDSAHDHACPGDFGPCIGNLPTKTVNGVSLLRDPRLTQQGGSSVYVFADVEPAYLVVADNFSEAHETFLGILPEVPWDCLDDETRRELESGNGVDTLDYDSSGRIIDTTYVTGWHVAGPDNG